MLRLTIGQLADQLKVEYAVASSLVKLIIASGKGREVGKVDMQGKKGKPSSIYELPEVFTLNLKNILSITCHLTLVNKRMNAIAICR